MCESLGCLLLGPVCVTRCEARDFLVGLFILFILGEGGRKLFLFLSHNMVVVVVQWWWRGLHRAIVFCSEFSSATLSFDSPTYTVTLFTTGDIHTNMECQKGGGFGSKLNYHMIENPRKGGMKKQNSNNAMIGGGGFNKP